MKQKLLVSFSGGRTSAYMAYRLKNDYLTGVTFDTMYVFANTGKEREETLEFVEECDKRWGLNVVWVEAVINEYGKGTGARVVNFETASRNGEPFEEMIKKYSIPNVAFPHCTRELKTNTIRNYAKSVGWNDYTTAIGIRYDEIDRISPEATKKNYLYPLVTYQFGANKTTINDFWAEQDFDLKLKQYEGNCDLCFKKSYRKLMMILKNNPELAEWWGQMENKYGDFIPPTHNQDTKLPIRFFRQNKSIQDIFEMIKLDEKQLRLFEDIDVSNGCTESCEVF